MITYAPGFAIELRCDRDGCTARFTGAPRREGEVGRAPSRRVLHDALRGRWRMHNGVLWCGTCVARAQRFDPARWMRIMVSLSRAVESRLLGGARG